MRRRTFIKHTGAAGLITLFTPSVLLEAFDTAGASTLEQDFRQPPASASPHVFWFWMNGHITKEGITLDLEAMKRAGISGVFNYDVGTGIPKGPVAYLSKEWAELKRYAVQEAHRLGLEFTLHNCPGWSASGGPWITPELAMQQVTWSETYVAGGRLVNMYLSRPASRLNHYRDIAVVAFPSLESEELLQTVKASTNSGPVNKNLLTGKEPPGVVVHPGEDHKAWLQLEFAEPYEARLLTFFISALTTNTTVSKPLDFGERTSIILEASDDGVNFRTITPINTGLDTELLLGDKTIVFDIPVTRAKYFRLTSTQARRYKQVQFSGITRLKNWMEKTNLRSRNIMNVAEASTIERTNEQAVTPGSIIDANAVVDISEYMDKEGLLNWQAPAGNWTVLRIGFTPTGALNRAAPEGGIGLECDKYNPEAITLHVHKMLEPLLPALKQLTGKKKIGLEIDSYEAGGQNWTPGFEQAFQQRWNYSILQYLPALAGGRIVRSVEVTERFLWDLRRLQADLMAENYYGRFRELCHQHGFTAFIEP